MDDDRIIQTTIPQEAFPPVFNLMGKQLTPKFYEGQPVLTFKDVDYLHERPEGTAKRNFIENKDHLNLNEDYFEITKGQKNEIRTLEIPNRGITVLTESGYLMLVKSFTDDLAWEVQRVLVKSYFGFKALWQQKQLERLAIKERQGLLVQHSAVTGQSVWVIHDRFKSPKVIMEMIAEIVYNPFGKVFSYKATYKGKKFSKGELFPSQFGTVVFPTKEAADFVCNALRNGINIEGKLYEGDGSDKTAQAAAAVY